jgi:SAM-dependent methyltransferase
VRPQLTGPSSDTAARLARAVRRWSSPRAVLTRTALRRLRGPISTAFGYDRGTPLDRPYIEQFLAVHAGDVRGRVMEVKSDDYTRRFGGADVSHIDVVDVDPDNARATRTADLDAPAALEAGRYDCILLTQVLQFLTPAKALPTLYEALAPGGVLLMTAPALAAQETQDSDRWRFPPAGVQDLLDTLLPAEAECSVQGRGNAVVAAAFLLGLAVEEVGVDALEPVDWRFPVVSLARVRRPPLA